MTCLKPRRKLAILLCGCALLAALIEVGAGQMVARLPSRQSVRDDVRAAVALAGPGSVLVVGNSLVLHGIDVAAVDRALGAGYTASKLAIVDSGYLDWLYGVASLFDRGSRPDVVVLAISPTQLVADRAPTGAAARMVWTVPNLVRYAVDRQPGLTTLSNLVFEHASDFFAVRSRLRHDTRRFVVPGYEALAREILASAKDTTIDTIGGERVAEHRLEALDALCARRGVRFVYLVVPTGTAADGAFEPAVAGAGARAGAAVLVPVSNRVVDAGWLLDGYHLNATGAAAFSARVGRALLAELGQKESGGRFAAPRIATVAPAIP